MTSTDLPHTEKHDAIVVLGAAVWANETPSPTLMRRTKHAIELYHRGAAPLLVLSGGLGKHPPSEAEAMARLCRAANVPQSALLLEDRSTSTIENATFSLRFLPNGKDARILVVSDRYHLPRAAMIFRKLGCKHVATSGPPRGKVVPWWRGPLMPVREAVAWPGTWWRMRSGNTQNALQK